MKGTGQIICATVFSAFLLLLYVHGQTVLFDLSYGIDAHNKQLTRLSEEYRRLKFEVERMKAPLLLESKMKQLSLNLGLPKEVKVIRVESEETKKVELPQHDAMISSPNNLMRFLGRWIDVAQAQPKSDN